VCAAAMLLARMLGDVQVRLLGVAKPSHRNTSHSTMS